MAIMVLFVDGSSVHFEKPPNFNLPQFVHGCRSLGMLMTEGFYIPFGMVKAVLDEDMSAQHRYTANPTIPTPNAPTTDKPQ